MSEERFNEFFSDDDQNENLSFWQRMIDERLIYEDAKPELYLLSLIFKIANS